MDTGMDLLPDDPEDKTFISNKEQSGRRRSAGIHKVTEGYQLEEEIRDLALAHDPDFAVGERYGHRRSARLQRAVDTYWPTEDEDDSALCTHIPSQEDSFPGRRHSARLRRAADNYRPTQDVNRLAEEQSRKLTRSVKMKMKKSGKNKATKAAKDALKHTTMGTAQIDRASKSKLKSERRLKRKKDASEIIAPLQELYQEIGFDGINDDAVRKINAQIRAESDARKVNLGTKNMALRTWKKWLRTQSSTGTVQNDDPKLQEALESLQLMGKGNDLAESVDSRPNGPTNMGGQARGLRNPSKPETDDSDVDMVIDGVQGLYVSKKPML